MATISLCMIVKNEQEVLARCLDCAKQFADEIIVVDTGSSDDTAEIARRYTDKVYFFEWIDDFSAARNFSFSKAQCDYIMWLDADDIIDEENIKKINALKQNLDVDVAMLRYNIDFDATGKPIFTYYRERIVRREKGLRWCEPVHEHIEMSGKIQKYDIAITHGHKKRTHSRRNLEIYQNRLAQGDTLSTRGVYYYARELHTHGMVEEAIRQYHIFFSRGDGWREDMISAACGLADCYVAQGQDELALQALYASFLQDIPRATVCCRLGAIYMRKGLYERAEYWYKTALHVPRPDGGFIQTEYFDFIPNIQLCCIYDKTGKREKALKHHEITKKLRPDDARVLYNDAYFYPKPSKPS